MKTNESMAVITSYIMHKRLVSQASATVWEIATHTRQIPEKFYATWNIGKIQELSFFLWIL